MKPIKNKKIFFLAGFPRAGNTLLTSILNQNPDVCCTPNSITLEMPDTTGKSWYANNIITFDNVLKTSKENELYLLLEKDFTCLDNTIEDQSDNYPNPKLG